MHRYFEKLLVSINDSIRSLDYEQFEKLALQAMSVEKSGHKIIATGLGKNVPICEKFEGTLLSVGLSAMFLHTNAAAHGDLGAVKDGDLVIMLTKSGETAESVYLYEHLKKRNVTVWLLTFNGESTLAKTVPNVLVLNLDHEGDLWDIVPNNSTTLYLIVLQAIAIIMTEKMNLPLEQFKANHPGGNIGELLGK